MQTVLNFVKKLSVLSLVAICTFSVTDLFGENPTSIAIVGGQGDAPYAAIVRSDRSVMELAGLPAEGLTYRVAMNSSKGELKSLSLPSSGLIYSVVLGFFQNGIIGGKGPSNSAYAAFVSHKGVVEPLAGLPAIGAIFWISVSNSHNALIGGQDNESVYAAFVSRSGVVRPIANLPQGINYSVAINNAGAGIMGGTSQSQPYAAFVSPQGVATPIQNLPTTAGIIYNVAIN